MTLRRALASAAADPPDPHAYAAVLRHCTTARLLLPGRHLHARLIVRAVRPSNFLASHLLSLYSRFSLLLDARRVFDEIPSKNLFSFNAMLVAYALHSHPTQTLRLFSSLPSLNLSPDAFTLSSLLKSLSNSSPPFTVPRLAAEQIHSFSICHGFISDLFVANGLITLYCRLDDLASAKELFDEMPQRDVISWNSIISGYSHAGHYSACLQLFDEMEKGSDGVVPNGITLACVLQACSQLKDLTAGIRVHTFAVKNGVAMDSIVWNSIIGFYARCGSLDYARCLLNEMPNKDGVSYGAMITGYMVYGYVDKALELFGQMVNPDLSIWNALIAGVVQNKRYSNVLGLVRSMQDYGLRPNAVTLSSVLPAISMYSNLLGGKQIHCYAIRNDCDKNIYVATALIDTYAKAGYLEGAQMVFEGMKIRSLIVWTAIISAYAAHGDANAALSFFNRMVECRIWPDPVTFTAVLSACAHAGLVKEARKIFDTMMPVYGIVPATEQYACMVGVFSRGGMLKEATEFIEKMPIEPNAKVWGALLNGAALHGDAELGKFVFKRLIEIEPECTGNYVIMANLYWRAGRWEEAEMVRSAMRRVGLEKIPGCSWIEMREGLEVFVARDTSKECSKEMYAVLEGMVGLMIEEGYVCKDELDEENCW